MAYINGEHVIFSTEVTGVVSIDNELSRESRNPVENKAITDVLNECSNAIKKSVSGEVVRVDDVSSAAHFLDCKVESKNLCSIGSTGNFVSSQLFNLGTTLEEGETYTISTVVNTTDTDTATCLIIGYMDNTLTFQIIMPRSKQGERVSSTFKATKATNSMRFYAANQNITSIGDTASFTDIQIEKGATATEYTPYVDVTTISIERFGKNLFPIGNVICTPNETDNNYSYTQVDLGYILPAGTYSLSAVVKSNDTDSTQCSLALAKNNVIKQYVLLDRSTNEQRVMIENKNIHSDIDSIWFYAGNNRGNSTGDTATFTDIQIEVGEIATDYEPHIKTQHYTPLSDGIVKNMASVYPNMTILTNPADTIISVTYNRDLNKAFAELQNAILSLGGNI